MTRDRAEWVIDQMRKHTRPDAQISLIKHALAGGNLGTLAREVYKIRLSELTSHKP